VYRQKHAREFYARAQKQGSTSRSSVDENAFGLPVRQSLGAVFDLRVSSVAALRFKKRPAPIDLKTKPQGGSPKSIRGVMS
jgi:hypothetical protein